MDTVYPSYKKQFVLNFCSFWCKKWPNLPLWIEFFCSFLCDFIVYYNEKLSEKKQLSWGFTKKFDFKQCHKNLLKRKVKYFLCFGATICSFMWFTAKCQIRNHFYCFCFCLIKFIPFYLLIWIFWLKKVEGQTNSICPLLTISDQIIKPVTDMFLYHYGHNRSSTLLSHTFLPYKIWHLKKKTITSNQIFFKHTFPLSLL